MAEGDYPVPVTIYPWVSPFQHIHTHKQDRTGDRPDSIELGEARCRIKIYMNLEKPEEAAVLVGQAIGIAQEAAKQAEQAGLMGAKK